MTQKLISHHTILK